MVSSDAFGYMAPILDIKTSFVPAVEGIPSTYYPSLLQFLFAPATPLPCFRIRHSSWGCRVCIQAYNPFLVVHSFLLLAVSIFSLSITCRYSSWAIHHIAFEANHLPLIRIQNTLLHSIEPHHHPTHTFLSKDLPDIHLTFELYVTSQSMVCIHSLHTRSLAEYSLSPVLRLRA